MKRFSRVVVISSMVAAFTVVGGAILAQQPTGTPSVMAADVKNLRTQHIEVLKRVVEILDAGAAAGRFRFRDACAAHVDLTNAQLVLADTAQNRTALLKEQAQNAGKLLRTVISRFEAGMVTEAEVSWAEAFNLEIKIKLAEQGGDGVELKRLRSQRVEVLKRLIQILDTGIRTGRRFPIGDACTAHMDLTSAELDLADTPQARIALLKAHLEAARKLLALVQSRLVGAVGSGQDVCRVEVVCLDINIRLAEHTNDANELKRLRMQRVELLARLVRISQASVYAGPFDLRGFCAALVDLTSAKLDLTQTPDGRIALLKEQEALLDTALNLTKQRAGAGLSSALDVARAEARALEIKIRILGERRGMNPAHTE